MCSSLLSASAYCTYIHTLHVSALFAVFGRTTWFCTVCLYKVTATAVSSLSMYCAARNMFGFYSFWWSTGVRQSWECPFCWISWTVFDGHSSYCSVNILTICNCRLEYVTYFHLKLFSSNGFVSSATFTYYVYEQVITLTQFYCNIFRYTSGEHTSHMNWRVSNCLNSLERSVSYISSSYYHHHIQIGNT